MAEFVDDELTCVQVDEAEARWAGRAQRCMSSTAGGQRLDVQGEGRYATAGVILGAVLVVAGAARPTLMPVLAGGTQLGSHPVEERREAVPVPLLERVAGHGQPSSSALVGNDCDLVH